MEKKSEGVLAVSRIRARVQNVAVPHFIHLGGRHDTLMRILHTEVKKPLISRFRRVGFSGIPSATVSTHEFELHGFKINGGYSGKGFCQWDSECFHGLNFFARTIAGESMDCYS
ncbi:MAG: hypothetical protein JWL59_3103 [Chthoniobacteraceae bacterium]|nr:hypothetical protein [Chthoniobacteraceae bacterium]